MLAPRNGRFGARREPEIRSVTADASLSRFASFSALSRFRTRCGLPALHAYVPGVLVRRTRVPGTLAGLDEEGAQDGPTGARERAHEQQWPEPREEARRRARVRSNGTRENVSRGDGSRRESLRGRRGLRGQHGRRRDVRTRASDGGSRALFGHAQGWRGEIASRVGRRRQRRRKILQRPTLGVVNQGGGVIVGRNHEQAAFRSESGAVA
jgi:hypothetical protein